MKQIIGKIDRINSMLQGFESVGGGKKSCIYQVESVIKKELPYEIRSFLVNSDATTNQDIQAIFMGYEPIPLESLCGMYLDPNDKSQCLFLATLSDLNNELIAGDDDGFQVIQDLNSEIEDGPTINDMKLVVPILAAGGYYLVLLYGADGSTEIAIATEDYCLAAVAPSLSEYLDNLRLGVEMGVFEVYIDEEHGEFDIEVPEVWKDRLEAVL